ncbi:membrane metalloprotease ARASP, chloroplastic-like [Oryza glaberrima]|uniref:membrane metalloprotease ARASP, chloroplastic-like n=1 Tax=Oryza glaberrima TaxID=4538 RepID=UPI00224C13A7|nr:membrane metalloprotease ARASP, chloroplastic-like [Oryza glaberrima]
MTLHRALKFDETALLKTAVVTSSPFPSIWTKHPLVASVLTTNVLVHKSGHFVAATSRGIHVYMFSVSFGPALACFRLDPVEYTLSAIPLGGYVGFPNDDPDSGFSLDDPDLLRNHTVPDRLLVVSAGVAANLLFAFLIIYARGNISRPPLFRTSDRRRTATIATITAAAPPLDLAEGAEGEVATTSDPARPPGRLPPAA